LNILYYGEPNIETGGGVSNVAYYLPHALSKKSKVTYFREIKANRDFIEIYFNIFNQFVKKEFDIIHFNTNPAWINGSSMLLRFAKLRNTRTVLNIHGIPHLEQRAEQWRPVSFFDWMRILSYCKLADRIVVNSEYMRNNVVVWYRINRDKVVVIPNGVNLKMFTESGSSLKLDGVPSILYIGHLSRLKGVDILISAIAQLRTKFPNIKLHLVGRGNTRGLALLAKNEGIEKNVIFHSWTKQSLTPSYYKGADICVFPSRQEGFGIVILEAMASGIPIIASDIPSFRELISNGVDGRLFKSEDSKALSKEITSLYEDPLLRKELSNNASEKVKMYSWEKVAEKYISLYKLLREG
jgi:glycosyltransferase involved in cell wall biosynthesis